MKTRFKQIQTAKKLYNVFILSFENMFNYGK